MTDEAFDARVTAHDSGVTIALEGTMDRAAKAAMDRAYARAARHPGEILLDFAGVDYINSTGIALIVGLLGEARADGRKVAASGLSDHYREVFQITRLSDFMQIYDDASTRD